MVDLNNNYTPYTPSRVSPRWGVFIRMPFYYRSIQRQGFEIEDRTPASGGGYGFKSKESLTNHTHLHPCRAGRCSILSEMVYRSSFMGTVRAHGYK